MVEHAIILAGGLGTRLQGIMGVTGKQLIRIRTVELFMYPIISLWNTGIEDFIVVVNPIIMDHVDKILEKYSKLVGFTYNIALNPYKESENGNSLIIGLKTLLKNQYIGNVVASVSDHIYSPSMTAELLSGGLKGDIAVLGDRKGLLINISEATKIITKNDKVVKVGKNLESYNYIDTGLFVIKNPGIIVEIFNENIPITMSDILNDPRIDAWVKPCRSNCLWKDIDVLEDLEKLYKPPLNKIINLYVAGIYRIKENL